MRVNKENYANAELVDLSTAAATHESDQIFKAVSSISIKA
jgi:hypothetical protein